MRENIHYQIDEYYLDLQKQGQEMKIIGEAETLQNPFPGLRPFRTAEAHLFFGRDGQAEDLIQRLMKTHFLGVLGNSGGGKSSLVRAGLIPALHRGRRQEQVSDWKIVLCRPGASPLENLAAALASARLKNTAREVIEPEVSKLLSDLKDSSFGLLEVEEGTGKHEKTLLIIDQFEELFRFHADIPPGEAAHFVDLLLTAVRQPDTHIYVVITMRSEFLGECVRYRGLPEIINEGQYLVPRLTGENVRRAVAGPLAVVGAPLDGALANRLVREVGDNMDQLPVLQHALMRTYRHWQARETTEPVSHADYEAVGGMEKALGNHADELLGSLDPQQQKIARLIFQRITDLSTGDKGGRRPTRMEEIYGVCESVSASRDEVDVVIDKFRQMDTSFLMPPPGVTLQDDSMLDISHESLIRNWSKLNQWAREEAANARQYGRLHQDRQYRDDGQLTWLTGAMLQNLTEWRNREHVNYWWASRYHPEVQPLHDWDQHKDAFKRNMEFLEGSRLEADNQEKQREEAIAREERQKQKTRYRTIIAVLSVVAAVLGLGLAFFAFYEQKKAVEAGKVANEQKILADSSARVAAEQRDIARIEKLKADSSAILAFEQKQLAEQKSREAEINLGIAKREEARALVALEQVKKEKSATEEQRRRAEDNYRIAQEKTVEVEKQAEVVKRALEATKTALRNVVSLTLTEVERLIYEIKYDSAFNRISTVISLDASKPEVSNALLEFAFWYCESGKLEKSADIIKKAYSLADKPMATYPGQIDIKLLRDLIHNLNPERDSMLFDRYYPQMVDVQGGTFDMGTKSGIEEKRKIKLNPFAKREVNPYANEEPVHKVSLSDFRICKTEITWWQYALFCEAKERNYLTPGWGADGDNPVVNVSWYDAVEYANWLSEQMGLNPAYDIDRDKEDINNNSVFDNLKWSVKLKDDSNGYRLPTESEWEYAARGGNKSKGRIYAGSNDLDSVGWYYADSGSRTRAVGQKKPNELGLYDMSGNVWEWCWDWYGDYKSEPQENPVGAEKGGSRVYRGGGWYYGPRVWRAAIRGDGGPSNGYNNLGFRLAVSLQ